MNTEEKLTALRALKQQYVGCTRCGLCEGRTQIAFANGAPNAKVMIVGEAPGEQEDKVGVPFVGKSGRVLEDILNRLGVSLQDETHITNTVLCRPPENRVPTPHEVEACRPRLIEQIRIVDPFLIIASGKAAAQALLGRKLSITKERGTIVDVTFQGLEPFLVPVMLTIHPAHILRNPDPKTGGLLRETTEDFRVAFEVVDQLDRLWYGRTPKTRKPL